MQLHLAATEPGLDGWEDAQSPDEDSFAPKEPLRSPASTAGKTCRAVSPRSTWPPGRYGARPRRPGRPVITDGGHDEVRLAATEPGLDGWEDLDDAARVGPETTAATEPGLDGRED